LWVGMRPYLGATFYTCQKHRVKLCLRLVC
jgi:hypothetical protein